MIRQTRLNLRNLHLGFSFKSASDTTSTTNTATTPSPPSTAGKTLSTIPELLELIFSFLSPVCIQRTITLVSKQWRSIARAFIVHRLYFNPEWFPVQKRDTLGGSGLALSTAAASQNHYRILFSRLRLTKVLECQLVQKPARNSFGTGVNMQRNEELAVQDELWRAFLEQLQELVKGTTNPLQVKELKLFHPMDLLSKVFPLLDCLPGLKRLRLENVTTEEVPLGIIFDACPGLKVLEVEADDTVVRSVVGTLVEGAEMRWESSKDEISMVGFLPKRTELKRLMLRNFRVEEKFLRRFIRACPDLRELGLLSLLLSSGDGDSGGGGSISVTKTWTSLYRDISDLCPRLETFEYTTIYSIQEVMDYIPGLRGIGSSGLNLALGEALDIRRRHMDRLTTLTIHGELGNGTREGRQGDLLQDYLCEAPLLLYLFAPKTYISLDRLDLNTYISIRGWFLNQTYDTYADVEKARFHHKKGRGQIWACRNLKTLHVNFERRGVDVGTAESSRLLFGYLSKVVPHLEELIFERSLLVLTLEGGLCLLQRMHGLRKLVITTRYCQKWTEQDFDWMAKRTTVDESWKVRRERAKRLDLYETLGRSSLAKMPPTVNAYVPKAKDPWWKLDRDGSRPVEDESRFLYDGVNMKNVGLLFDLIDLQRERDIGKWTCWPEMESFEVFRIESALFEYSDLNEMMDRIRPDIRFSFYSQCF